MAVKRHGETSEQQVARCHFVDQRIQPVDDQQFVIRSAAAQIHERFAADTQRIGNDSGQRKRDLLEGIGARGTQSANPDIGTMPKMFPGHSRFDTLDG